MAISIGQLRENQATYGEKQVYRLLIKNLPNDFTVYTECPVTVNRSDAHPDFIVLTNYGVVVIEVKDWKSIQMVDAYHAYVNTTANGSKRFNNPVQTVRGYALNLKKKFMEHKTKYNMQINIQIPYGYAVVFPHIGQALKTQLQRAWGDNFVLNLYDLDSGIIKKRIRETISTQHITTLNKAQMDFARSIINPEINIDGVILDEIQESVVMEKMELKSAVIDVPNEEKIKPLLFEFGLSSNDTSDIEESVTEENKKIAKASFRLVRGSMGSGKTVVLRARARHLAKNNPDWKILVLSFNKAVARDASRGFKGFKNIESTNIHALITSILKIMNKYEWREVISQDNWLKNKEEDYPIIKEMGIGFISDELKWIQDIMLKTRGQYLQVKRVGRGTSKPLNQVKRNQIYDLLEALNRFLDKQRQFTYETMVLHFLDRIEKEEINYPQYDAILIDEAQDFAPSWIKVVNHLLKEGGTLFLADDPKQSIFRFFSWRQKGVDVIGRTKHLRRPYRNSKQIFSAAEAILRDDVTTIERLKAEGEYDAPDLNLEFMVDGVKPSLIHFPNFGKEIDYIGNQVNHLRQKEGIAFEEIAIIHPYSRELAKYSKSLPNKNLNFITCKTVKGMEYKAVFFCGLDFFFREDELDEAEMSHQRSMIYMSMGRAKSYLIMTYRDVLSGQLDVLNGYVNRWRID